MRFEKLTIANLRCLEHLEFSPGPKVSLVLGANGSGKTSLLEGFSIASLGRSFLTTNVTDVVRNGAPGLSVRALVYDPAEDMRFSVLVRKLRGDTQIEIDGVAVMAASTLAQRIPTLVINSKAADILTDSPSNRRALVDRTLFHVEQSYVEVWKRYRNALRQRNELLRNRSHVREADYWHEQLVGLGETIDRKRLGVIDLLNARLEQAPLLTSLGRMSLAYAPGWNREAGYRKQLEEGWERDCRLGYTTTGIHRADITLRGRGQERTGLRRLSRGQAKLVVVTMFCALSQFILDRAGKHPVFLVDDLHAELDDKMCAQAVDMIIGCDGQSIFTAIRPQDLPSVVARHAELFHVEQLPASLPA